MPSGELKMPGIFCQNCGKMVQPGDLFCQKCGSSITLKTNTSESAEAVQPERGKEVLDTISDEERIKLSNLGNEVPKQSLQGSDPSRAKGTYLFWLLGALIGGVIVGSIEFGVGRASSFEGALLYGFLLSLAWILGSNLKGEQNYGRLNIFVIMVFIAPIVYLLTTGKWWIGPEPKGRAMNLGESFISIVLVYLMMFVLGACSLGFAHLWNIIRPRGESREAEPEPAGKMAAQIETPEIKQVFQSPSIKDEHVDNIPGEQKFKCPHCDQDHPEGTQYCLTTGKKILIPPVCFECGNPIDPNWQHCGYCGRKLNQAEGMSKQQAPQAVDFPPAPVTMAGLPKTRTGSAKLPWLIIILGFGGLLIVAVIVFKAVWNATPYKMVASVATSAPKVNIAPAGISPTPSQSLGMVYTKVSPKDGMVMLYVTAGDFLMGSLEGDSQAGSDEKPQHSVWLDSYWIDRTEVTNAMYARCMAEGACTSSQYADDSAFNGPDQPVVGVDWNDANAYCAWAGQRLPTEAEWEKAARGTAGRIYPWGDQPPDAQLLNYNQNVGKTSNAGSYPVGASPYGALDMAGNVWEWVADWYDISYYSRTPARNPSGPSSGDGRSLRGGSWDYYVWGIRSGDRYWYSPDFSGFYVGFRCAASPP
jgi:formylglycine-generating enzyme required for sulfatase activity